MKEVLLRTRSRSVQAELALPPAVVVASFSDMVIALTVLGEVVRLVSWLWENGTSCVVGELVVGMKKRMPS